MKLFYLQPNWHGPTSFFVMAETADQAADAINAERMRHAKEHCGGYFQDGWGGDGAVRPCDLSVADVGQVLSNDNG